jgi:probable phosphoglycerate mutase
MGLFYLVRHGETEWNAAHRLCGRSDVPLSEAGCYQAQRLAERFKSIPFEALYSSPLRRAIQTAHPISRVIGLEPILDDRLVELNYGAWEGVTLGEIPKNDPETFRAWDLDPGQMAPPAGESGFEAQQRVVTFLDFLAAKHPRGHIVVVFHKTVCRLAICHILGIPTAEYRRLLVMGNAALNIIQSQGEGWQLVTYNDTSHLPDDYADLASLAAGF